VAGLAHDLNNVFETIAEAAELLSGMTRLRRSPPPSPAASNADAASSMGSPISTSPPSS
jgi:hypothetical protein